MHKKFDIQDKTIVPTESENNLIDIYINPDEIEKQNILQKLDFDEHTLTSALDADEIARIEFEEDYSFIVWKIPKNYSFNSDFIFNVTSMGIILSKEKITFILNEEYELYNRRELSKINSLSDYFLKVLFYTIRHFIEHIKAIDMMSRDIQKKINTSLENKYLIQMLNLSESFVYYLNAINSNGNVLNKLRNAAHRLSFNQDEIDMIDDLIIENNQCYKQAEIYSTILSGLMDTRSSIVNNNMNMLLKKLTIINVIFLPLNLIASIGGMSEFTMMTEGVPWHISYSLFGLGMVALGFIIAKILNRINIGKNKSTINFGYLRKKKNMKTN